MSSGDEKAIIKQYQPLIRALIPYEQQNKLLEGINKFSKRLPGNVRKIVREEVIRLTSLTDAPADNSAFARFPVMKFKHFGVQMRLDKVGAQILKNETALYQDRYTVGVFESVMNSSFYQTQIKKEQFQKVVEAFNVESQSFSDIDFGDDIAIRPNFTVSSPDFENGRNCAISALSFKGIALETKRPPMVNAGEPISFLIPEVSGFSTEPTEVSLTLSNVKYNKELGKYESHFLFEDNVAPAFIETLRHYISHSAYKQPLQLGLEIERAMQDLERDRILENSPWLPVLLAPHKALFKPLISLLTKGNTGHTDAKHILNCLAEKPLFEVLSKELQRFNEAFVFSGTVKTKQGDVKVVATHRQLLNLGQLNALIYLLVKGNKFTCIQCRLDEITSEDKLKAFAIHDINISDFESLKDISHVMYCKDVTHYLSNLTLSSKCDVKPLSRNIMATGMVWPIDLAMEEELDKRRETRYLLDTTATVRIGLLTKMDAQVSDISAKGMKIFIKPYSSIQQDLRVSVPELKLKNEKYKVVDFIPDTGVVRLCLSEEVRAHRVSASVNAMIDKQKAHFKTRDVTRIQRFKHRYVWELAARHMPSLSVLCVMNRRTLDRLKTVYQSETSDDLYPFSRTRRIIPLHGFFADKGKSQPKSKLLEDMFKEVTSSSLIVHCIRKSDNRLVFINEKDFLYSKLRLQIKEQLTNNKIQLSATDASIVRCYGAVTPLTKKRLAQLSKLNKAMYEKLEAMQAGYTHCIFLTNMSALHHDLVIENLVGKAQNESTMTNVVA